MGDGPRFDRSRVGNMQRLTQCCCCTDYELETCTGQRHCTDLEMETCARDLGPTDHELKTYTDQRRCTDHELEA